jgi:hypothetical protein
MYVNQDPPEPRSIADHSDYDRANLTVEVNRKFVAALRDRQAQAEFFEWTRVNLRASELYVVSTGDESVMIELRAETAPTITVNSRGEAMFFFQDGQHRAERSSEPQYRAVPVMRPGRRQRKRRWR